MAAHLTDDWHGAYRQGWGQNRLRPASFAHPAKAAYGLTVRIYEHALEEGWIEPGQVVLDPFAGIGGFALEAMRHGLHFIGCELEKRFCDMARGCDCTGISKADWARFQGRWGRMRYEGGRHWCPECLMKAAVIAGEREFKVAKKRKIKPLPLPGTKWGALAKAHQATIFDAAPTASHAAPLVSYAVPTASYTRNSGKIPCTGAHHYRGNVETWAAQGMPGTAVIVQGDSRRLGEVLERARICLSSPPYAASLSQGNDPSVYNYRHYGGGGQLAYSQRYGTTEGQLSNLPDTGFEAALAVSSPVYIGTAVEKSSSGVDLRKQYETYRSQGGGASFQAFCRTQAQHSQGYGSQPGQLAQMPEGDLVAVISSPPYSPHGIGHDAGHPRLDNTEDKRREAEGCERRPAYGTANGQLAALPEGDHAAACERPVIAISSPPYSDGGLGTRSKAWFEREASGDYPKIGVSNFHQGGYGDNTDGQLVAMPPGDHAEALEAGAVTGRAQACISSPPWEASEGSMTRNFSEWHDEQVRSGKMQANIHGAQATPQNGYGTTAGQLGQETGSTFWAASRAILEQVYQVLAPNAHAIFVCKRFVRSKKIVEFPLQWARLCEAVGFTWIHHHKAWLVEDRGAQHTLDGGLEKREVKRMSFFRRLHAAKYPHLEILYEDVLCFVKE